MASGKNNFLSDYLSFNGRLGRRDCIIRQTILAFLIVIAAFLSEYLPDSVRKPLLAVVFVVAIVGSISTNIRRYHDTDRRGWYLLLALVPILNLYFGIYLLWCVPGTDGPNRFGESNDLPDRLSL